MKKSSLFLVLAASMLLSAAPVNTFAAVGGTNPHPHGSKQTSTFSTVVSAILAALRL